MAESQIIQLFLYMPVSEGPEIYSKWWPTHLNSVAVSDTIEAIYRRAEYLCNINNHI